VFYKVFEVKSGSALNLTSPPGLSGSIMLASFHDFSSFPSFFVFFVTLGFQSIRFWREVGGQWKVMETVEFRSIPRCSITPLIPQWLRNPCPDVSGRHKYIMYGTYADDCKSFEVCIRACACMCACACVSDHLAYVSDGGRGSQQ
jgi:hypothetical protein